MQTTAQDTPMVTESINSFYKETFNRVRKSFGLNDACVHFHCYLAVFACISILINKYMG